MTGGFESINLSITCPEKRTLEVAVKDEGGNTIAHHSAPPLAGQFVFLPAGLQDEKISLP